MKTLKFNHGLFLLIISILSFVYVKTDIACAAEVTVSLPTFDIKMKGRD